jgi:hypothetical protein
MVEDRQRRLTTIAGNELVAVVDEVGCRIASLVPRRTGRELLFVAPWEPRPLADGPATTASWLASWRGGWDVLTPNAGAPATVGGVARGFHGEASVGRWAVERLDASSVRGRWRDRTGLTVERAISLDGMRLRVDNRVANETSTPVPFAWVEHMILDAAPFGEGSQLDLSGSVLALGATRGPSDGWHAVETWPNVRTAGTVEDWGRLPPAGSSRSAVLTTPRSPIAVAGRHGTSVQLRWSVDTLPYLWLWIEHDATRTLPDGCAIDCVGVEPANTASGEGLAESLRRGDGCVLAPGDRWTSWVELEVAVDSEVDPDAEVDVDVDVRPAG